jgi:hypothetical protein
LCLAFGALARISWRAAVVLIRTRIVPPHLALGVITSYPVCHKLSASLTIVYSRNRWLVVIVGPLLVVHFFEIWPEFHQSARRQRIVSRARLFEKGLVHKGVEDGVGFLDGDALVCGLRVGGGVIGVVELALAVSARVAGELGCFVVLEGHYLARGCVVGLEHVVEQAADVGDFGGGEAGCELGEGVGGFVDEGIGKYFVVLVERGADLEVVGLDFGIDGLDGGCEEGLGDVVWVEGAVGI